MSADRPLVSILIPCYNAERYVGEAIGSALVQDYEPIEVLVVDDGSTDKSLEVIRSFSGDPRFRHETGPNRGGNAARNRLLELARGEFVQFLDADDRLCPNKLSRQMMAASEDAAVVVCDYSIFGDRSQIRQVRYPTCSDDVLAYFVRNSVIVSAPLHKRRMLLEAGGFDERLHCCQEYELHFRLATRYWRKVVHIPEVLCHCRRVCGSVSSNEARVFSVKSRLLMSWHQETAGRGQANREFTCAVAETLYASGRHLVRHRLDNEARIAFDYARSIAPGASFPVTFPMRVLTAMLGPIRAEHCRALLYNAPSR